MWEEKWSSSRQRPYYYNQQTGESVWDRPASLGPQQPPARIHCHHILLKHQHSRRPHSFRHPLPITRTESEAHLQLSQMLPIGSLDAFKQLAEQWSECSSAQRQGDLGWFGPGEMQSTFFLLIFRAV